MSWFWIQFLTFQLLWLVAVVGGNNWLVLSMMLIGLHFIFTPSRKLDWRVLPVALIGITVDAILTWSGFFAFDHFPLWLAALWISFILTLGHSMSWLSHLPRLLLIPIGAVAGTLSYYAGWKLGAVDFPRGTTTSSIAVAIVWATLLPSLVILNDRIRRQQ